MLFLDTSALLKRYLEEEGTPLVLRRMDEDRQWVVSSAASTEAGIALCRLGFERVGAADVWSRFEEDWKHCLVVPVDQACLALAAEIGCRHQVRTLDAVHLAAAERLPRPFVILTFDRRMADAARSMDLSVEGA